MEIIRAANLVPQPWRNGSGTTRLVHAEADWQISVADLDGEADFSLFHGRDRIFTLIEGTGATLEMRGRTLLPCRFLVPVLFPGDVPIRYRPVAGRASAFNVVAVRGVMPPRVCVASLAGVCRVPHGTTSVFCVEGHIAIGSGTLGAGDTALHPNALTMEAHGAAVVIVVLL